MVDEVLTSSFDGNAARETLPPETPRAVEPPESRPFAIRAAIPSWTEVDDETAQDELDRGFISDRRLADMLFERAMTRVGPGVVEVMGRRYVLHNAVRVVGRRESQMTDPYGLAGTVERLDELVRAGARFGGHDMQLGSIVYRVERGVTASADEPAASAARPEWLDD